MHYNYFRDYNPNTGRYIQSDPIGLQGGVNTYVYVLQNPLRYSDSTGLIICYLLPLLSFLPDGTALDLNTGVGVNLGIAGGLSLSSSGITGSLTVGTGISLGASAGISVSGNAGGSGGGIGFGTEVSISGGVPGGSVSITSGTNGVTATASGGIGFGFAVVSGFNVNGTIVICEEEEEPCR